MTHNQAIETAKKPRTVRVLMFDVSLPWAYFWYDAFNILLFIGALVVAIGTYGSIRMGAVKEHFSDVRISANEAETNRAKESASLANERAAEANLKAESERVERLKLEAKLAPRLFSPEQRATFISTLIQFKGTAADIIVFPTGTSDIGPLQHTIATTLNDSGWTIRAWSMLNGEIVIGVGVATKSGANPSAELAANSLLSALNTAGIQTARSGPFVGNDFPMPAVGPAPVGETAPIRIYVGTKPP